MDKIIEMKKKPPKKKEKKIFSNLSNTISAIKTLDMSIKFNSFSNSIEINNRQFTDIDFTIIMQKIQDNFVGLGNNEGLIRNAVSLYSQSNQYNPIKDIFFQTKWDGKERAETILIDYFGIEDNIYSRLVTRTNLIGAVKRIYNPGCQHDTCIALVGDIGLRKSTFLENLAMGYHTSGIDNLDTKDSRIKLIGSWIIEIEEFNGFSKAGINKIKGFITCKEDKVRLPYDKFDSIFKRNCVFFITTNEFNFIIDPSQERRIQPLVCTKKAVIDDIDFKQVWAEVYCWYLNDEKNYVEDISEFKRMNWHQVVSHKEIEENEYEVLNVVKNKKNFTTKNVCEWLNIDFTDKRHQTLLSRILRTNGFKKQEKRIKGIKNYYWNKSSEYAELEYLTEERENMES